MPLNVLLIAIQDIKHEELRVFLESIFPFLQSLVLVRGMNPCFSFSGLQPSRLVDIPPSLVDVKNWQIIINLGTPLTYLPICATMGTIQ